MYVTRNICSARFSPIPLVQCLVNMWKAQCVYIRNLIALKSFPKYVNKMIQGIKRQWESKASSHHVQRECIQVGSEKDDMPASIGSTRIQCKAQDIRRTTMYGLTAHA
jgi:hypothetical protein